MLLVFALVALLFVVDFGISGPIGNAPVFNTMSSKSLTKRGSTKYVVAHFMVGNTYPYTLQNWSSDIHLAYQNGIDGFALNVGRDSWQPQQVANAFQAAQQSGTGFKLFLSFDMTSLPCDSASDAATLRNYITTYASHPNHLIYNGRVFASTFSGESCHFGQGSVQSGWSTQFLQQLSGENAVYFVPSFFVDTSAFQGFDGVINGMFNWNSGWPTQLTASSVPNFASSALSSLAVYIGATVSDEQYINALNPMGASYMAAVSPWFFTHYSPQTYNKNWIYLSDEHLYAKRWESLIRIRDQVDIVQIASWNDFGESHYIGPIEGAQPNSQAWVNGFNHTGWLSMTSYYATAFKTGTYPAVSKDQIIMWSRPHPASATAPDPVGPPTNHQITADKIWAVVFAASPATVTLSTSSSESQTFDVGAGATKLSLPINPGGYMKAVLQRNGQTVIDLCPSFSFNPSPPSYNFNAFVVSSS
ncbi:glycoside hydrolase family 71 protein [Boletus reticuloceps]|uniref:Glycoside hydrolase family 71 protein n=1 Tax=Boletus reticuloceps TaxID=495285 RepID=A0A8I2YUK9_9AGAM|nr:glycoside hydrolase family 71 protein [Boletus reticuloceps]